MSKGGGGISIVAMDNLLAILCATPVILVLIWLLEKFIRKSVEVFFDERWTAPRPIFKPGRDEEDEYRGGDKG
jgi:hypothetical protein